MAVQLRQKFFQTHSYLAYWLKAVNEHALHPPFIFELYTKVIKADEQKPIFRQIEAYRKELLQKQEKINVQELGAGSSMSRKRERPISQIARHSLTSARFSRLLYRLIQHMQATNILELGTSLGINTLYLSAAAPSGKIFTLEGCPQTAGLSKQIFTRYGSSNIQLREEAIDHTLPQLLSQSIKKLDAAYIDANHTYSASLRYFEMLLPYLHEHSFLVVDDIYWSAGMKKAWQEMQQHPNVCLSIDLYQAGILFFNSRLQKAHYVLAL